MSRKHSFAKFTGIVFIVLANIAVAGTANAATLTVDDSGGAGYASIQAAINTAAAGDTILVYSGTYNERVNVNKQLILRGMDNGVGKPIVNAGGTGSAITLSGNGITLDGFTVRNGGSGLSGGIYLAFLSNNNILINNTASGNNNGIYLYGSSNNILINNTASGNTNIGIYLSGYSNNTLINNTASGNSYGIYLSSSQNNRLINNNASGNTFGIYILQSSNNNLIYNNTVSRNTNSGIYIRISNSLIYNNYFNNSKNVDVIQIMGTWNTTKTSGTNIVGGPYLGGNFWANLSGTGYSQTCTDANGDGICDLSYNIGAGNFDYLPLSNVTTDTTPPASITNLRNVSYAPDFINWTWTDPSDPDFSYVMVYLNSIFQANVSKSLQYYNAAGLQSGTAYTISTHSVDSSGNINQTWVNDTKFTTDTTPPASTTNLRNVSYAPDFINWTWSDPADADFDYVIIYIDGSFRTNISKGVQSYNATGLALDTSYTISTHTVDSSGNINPTWVNNTAMTDAPSAPPSSANITTPDGYGKYTSTALDLGKNVTFASIQLSGRGKIKQARVYTTNSFDSISWSNWTQATGSSVALYSVASGQYGRFFGYIIVAPTGTVISGVTIGYVESPDGVVYIG